MTLCRCGAPISWAQTPDGEKFPIESRAAMAGPGRYQIVDYEARPWRVVPVTERASVLAYADHRLTCPRA